MSRVADAAAAGSAGLTSPKLRVVGCRVQEDMRRPGTRSRPPIARTELQHCCRMAMPASATLQPASCACTRARRGGQRRQRARCDRKTRRTATHQSQVTPAASWRRPAAPIGATVLAVAPA